MPCKTIYSLSLLWKENKGGGCIMNKLALIIDTPETCSKCPFMYEFNGFKKCSILNVVKV